MEGLLLCIEWRWDTALYMKPFSQHIARQVSKGDGVWVERIDLFDSCNRGLLLARLRRLTWLQVARGGAFSIVCEVCYMHSLRHTAATVGGTPIIQRLQPLPVPLLCCRNLIRAL